VRTISHYPDSLLAHIHGMARPCVIVLASAFG